MNHLIAQLKEIERPTDKEVCLLNTLNAIKDNIHRVLNNHAEGIELASDEYRTFLGALSEIAENEIKKVGK